MRLSPELLRRAKKKAANEGRTVTSLIEEGLKLILADARVPRPEPVQLPISTACGGTLPGIDLNRSSDLEDRMHGL